MRIAIIDLGTNSVRFDVHLVGLKGRVRLLHREKLMIRLGQDVFVENKLEASAIRRTVQAFLSFRQTATLLHATKIIAFGTSALREAKDAEKLIELIRKRTGIDIRVISGEEEAQLIAAGILANEQPVKGRFGLIDIGGGSTEMSICRGKKVLHSASFQLGAARLQQIFLQNTRPASSGKPDPVQLLTFRKYVKNILLLKIISDEWPQITRFIGSSGTIRALERIIKKTTRSHNINRRTLGKLIKAMSSMTRAQLLQIPGMEPKRVDIILSGAVLLEECMKALGTKLLVSTTYSLRDGILDREIRLLARQQGTEIRFQLEDIQVKAGRLGCDRVHSRQVTALAETLFDRTKRLHKLHLDWKRYLSAAALLHDVGDSLTPSHHEIHSYYVVKNTDFLAMEKWESEFIAQLCLHHSTNTFSKKDLGFIKDKVKRHAFVRLLAILRVADALDRGHKASVHIRKIILLRKCIKIVIAEKDASDLEVLRMDQKKTLFEKTFRRQLTIEKLAKETQSIL